MIVLDFETNSANIRDVIEVAAFRVELINGEYKTLDTFHRYYFSRYEVNPHALAVHKLSPDRLEKLRKTRLTQSVLMTTRTLWSFAKTPKRQWLATYPSS